VTTRPRDVVIGTDVPILLWRRQKWRCWVSWCERKTFVESLPGIPARSRLTAQLRQRAAEAIGEHTRSVRFDTGLVNISGAGGLFAQIDGRNSKTVIEWIEPQDDAWRAGITHVAIDTSATHAEVIREALPHAIVILDRFHLVTLANRAVTDYRRELAWTNWGRRGRKIDPEWAQAQPAAARRREPDQGGAGEMHQAMRPPNPPAGFRSVARPRNCSGIC